MFTHHIAPFLSYRVLLTLRSVSSRLSLLSSHRAAWCTTVFTPRSLQHLLYLASSTSSSFPSLYFACLDLTQCSLLSDQHLDLVLRCFPHLTSIHLSHLHRLSLHSLTLLSLHLSASPSATSQLQRLTFHAASFPFSLDDIIPHHPALTHVDLSASLRLASRSLAKLAHSFLTSLTLSRCTQLSDASFAFLLPGSNSQVAQQPKQALPLHALTHLDVSGCHRLTSKACLAFSFLPSLGSLSISSCPRISTVGLHHLSSPSSACRSSLTSLSLAALLKLTDCTCIPFLARLPSLTHLDLADTSLSSSAILHLMRDKAPTLQRVVVDGCDKVSSEGIAALLTARMVDVRASFNYHLTSDIMAEVVQGKEPGALQTLALRYTSIADPLFLAQRYYSTLTSLDLSGNRLAVDSSPSTADDDVWKLTRTLPRLHSLSLASCILSPGLLSCFSRAAPGLHHLDLSNCQSLTNSLLRAFPALFPSLSSLVLDHTLVNDTSLLILSQFPTLSSLSLHETRLISSEGMKLFHPSPSSSQSMSGFHHFFSSLFSSSASTSQSSTASSHPSPSSSSPSTSSSPSQGAFSSLPSLSNFSLPSLPSSLSFDFPSSFSLPSSISSHLPHVHLPGLSSMTSLPTHLSIPRPSLTLHSLHSHLRSSNLSFPSSLSSFSSPFSSAFSSINDEPTSPFSPSSIHDDVASSSSFTRPHAAMEEGDEEEEEEDEEEGTAEVEEPETIAPPSPPLGSLSSTSSLSHTDDENDEDGDGMSPSSPLSLSSSAEHSMPAPSLPVIPLVPFAQLTFLHVCCINGAVGKEDKLVAMIKRAHPHCTVEGESERQSKEDKEKEERERRERRQRDGLDEEEQEEEDEPDDDGEDGIDDLSDAEGDALTWDASDDEESPREVDEKETARDLERAELREVDERSESSRSSKEPEEVKSLMEEEEAESDESLSTSLLHTTRA